MASGGSTSSIKNNEQLKNLDQVLREVLSPLMRDALRQFLVEFMETRQLYRQARFRNDIGSLVEQIYGPPDSYVIYYRGFLFRVIFSLSTNSQLTLFLEIRHLSLFAGNWDVRGWKRRYEREMFMYHKVLPLIHAVWAKGEQPPFLDLCASTTWGDVLLLENSSEANFDPKGVNSLLDLADAQIVLKAIARFHASSTAIIHADGVRDGFEGQTLPGMFDGDAEMKFYCDAFPQFIEHVLGRTGVGAGVKVWNAFECFVKNFEDARETYCRPSANGLNVIVHGHMCTRNILFDDTDQCQFIDFQRSRLGSPALDVMYFLMSSVKIDIVENECDSLMSCYLEEFNAVTARVGGRYLQKVLHADLLAYKRYIFHDLLRIAQSWIEGWRHDTDEWDVAFKRVLESNEFIRTLKFWVCFLE